MATIRPEVTGRASGAPRAKTKFRTLDTPEPLAVSPRQACQLLNVGNTYLYELIAAGELDSFRDGRSRKITVDSIRRYIARRLAANQ